MSSQHKLSSMTSLTTEERNEIGHVLDLEKHYFNVLWNLFTSNEFINDLKVIEQEIQRQYTFLSVVWEEKNKLKVPAERLVRQYVYKNLAHLVRHIYPSPVSSDVAFITDDAIINIDIKTLDNVGNRGDIFNLQFESNQSSFKNHNLDEDETIPNSGVKVECLLPAKYSYNHGPELPMLTFFFVVVYNDNGRSFQLYRGDDLKTIYLKCLPNGVISKLFDNDIVSNFKTYKYLESKHGFTPVFLTDDVNNVPDKVREFVRSNPQFRLINGRTKLGAYNSTQVHPKYHTNGVSWFPVSRQDKRDKTIHHYYLEAVDRGHTNRMSNETLIVRYDSHDIKWDGLKKYKVN